MRIAVSTFGGDGGKSGISQYIIQLLREFARQPRGNSFDVIGYADEKAVFVPPSPAIGHLAYGANLRGPIRNVLWHQVSLPGVCRRLQCDVLFLPAGNRRLTVSAPCPTVGTVHDFSSIHVPGKYDGARTFYITRALPFLIRRLTHVLTVSESSKRDIVEYAGVPENKVTVTPLAADPAVYFRRDPLEAAELLSRRHAIRPPFLLYTSRIEHPGKNHARLIRAFADLKRRHKIPHQLVLAGTDRERADEVHREAAQSGFADDILFTGFVAAEDLPLFYQAADIFVFPSLYEGFGLPILEAMACGTPVACSNVSSIPEVAGEAAVLFDPADEASIAAALWSIITEPELHARLAACGLARSAKFNWSRTAAQTLDAIRSVASPSEKGGSR
jgi:glycosyltransferase involved in cell wall biosynthesis